MEGNNVLANDVANDAVEESNVMSSGNILRNLHPSVGNAPMFKIPCGMANSRWIRIGVLTTAIGGRMNGFSVIITGTSNFGSNVPGMDIIQVSTRGGLNFQVYTLIPGGIPATTYGYRIVGGNTEIWIQESHYSYEKNCVVTLAKDLQGSGDEMLFGCLNIQFSSPSGFVAIPIIGNIHRYALAFSNMWQGTNVIHGGDNMPHYPEIDVAMYNCVRVMPDALVSVPPSNHDNFRIVRIDDLRSREKTVRIINNSANMAARLHGVGAVYVLAPRRFVDLYIDNRGEAYYMA